MAEKLSQFMTIRMRPFQTKGFRLFFFAQMFSLIGTWSHELARSYLVLEIAGTATALGTLLLASALPALLLSLHGGVLADRMDSRRIILITKCILAVSALVFFFLAKFTDLQLWVILIFSFLEGILNSYDSPAYTATFARLVQPQDFKMAITLQSTNFHLSRMMGPAIAGIIMSFFGVEWVFLFDAITYIGVIVVIRKVELRHVSRDVPNVPSAGLINIPKRKLVATFSELFEGLRYFHQKPTLRFKLLQFFVTLILIVPVTNVVLRSFLKTKFQLDGGDFGFLFSFPAFGSMAAAFVFILANFQEPIRNLKYSVPLLAGSLVLVNYVPSPQIAAVLLAVTGFFLYLCVNSITQSLHFEVEDRYRGRLGSLVAMGFAAISPLMSFPLGLYSDVTGHTNGIVHPVVAFLAVSLLLALLFNKRVRGSFF